MQDYILNIHCSTNYKWDIQTDNNSLTFDADIFSLSLHIKQINIINEFADKAGKEIYNRKCTPNSYLTGVTTPSMAKFKKKQVKELWNREGISKKDSSGKYYMNTLGFIGPSQSILAYQFDSSMSIYIYHILSQYINPIQGNQYLLFAKNHYALDGLIYYIRYKQFQYMLKNIKFFAYEYENELFEKSQNYLQTNKINKIPIKKPMNNEWVNDNMNKVNNIDLSIVDINIDISDFTNIRYTYLFQSQLPPIILSLHKLNKNGTLLLNTCLIPNKLVYNFISYLSCFFEETKIIDFKDSELHGTGQLIYSYITFYKFKGMKSDEMNKLVSLNKLYFELDPTGGYLFNTQDEELKKQLNITYTPPNFAEKYITNIVSVNDKLNYDEYKEYIKMKLMGSIRNFNNRMDIYSHIDDLKYMENKCNTAKMEAIHYAKIYDLPLLDWINDTPAQYFDRMIANKFKNIGYVSLYHLNDIDFKKQEIGIYSDIKCDRCIDLLQNIAVSESAYQYIEKINYDKYKDVELFINGKYKQLNKQLQDEYNINISGKYVSRAWIKFFELLSETGLLNKFKDELDIFFICEAPGNFINSMNYFIKTKTKIKNYNWAAQSLSQELADFYDEYGFIAKTKNQWDLGPKKTGDILDWDNQKYYYEKYKNKDLVVGDCGEKWSGDAVPDNKNLSIYQLFYALLIPKEGGNFVIKTFSANNNKLYLALLYIICQQYEKVIVFKSNTNFWSPEVYLVGINNKGLDDKNRQAILEIAENTTKGQTKYPIKELPDEFINKYNDIMYKLISFAADIKKFFVFLSSNSDVFDKNKGNIYKMIAEKNRGWGDKYIYPVTLKI